MRLPEVFRTSLFAVIAEECLQKELSLTVDFPDGDDVTWVVCPLGSFGFKAGAFNEVLVLVPGIGIEAMSVRDSIEYARRRTYKPRKRSYRKKAPSLATLPAVKGD